MEAIENQIAKLDAAISNKDIESTLAIYCENASMVKLPGEVAIGIDEIRAHYEKLFSLNIPMTIRTEIAKVIQSENTALVTTSWILEGVDPEGNAGRIQKIANMVFTRNDSDRWLLLIDNPFGPELVTAGST